MYASRLGRAAAAAASSRALLGTTRHFTASARQLEAAAASSTVAKTESSTTPSKTAETEVVVKKQAPNRAEVWSRSQRPRAEAMTGPRFEQTDFDLQPQPYAAIELIHKEPVRWTHERVVACDGGGGPAGHPRIFINTDKPEICTCGYCGLPFANEHHRKHLESLPATSYPL
ncbi:lactobacillus shifted protein-like protein [Echria macrotheca]|uniref:Lactobacillus shifted protein-like protein n=1 Tax=Echria macrotheca TaxID=438768 RepID=A0AAJ0F1Z6_9PEZI|nr:lactobacillus shifted protein-like protein [Echria macrotheca]